MLENPLNCVHLNVFLKNFDFVFITFKIIIDKTRNLHILFKLVKYIFDTKHI